MMAKKVLALITARGGSKGLKNKNILEFNGQPLIHWSIKAGLEAASVDRVVVSTDSKEIAEISKLAGAEVPFLRPAELAGDASAHILAMIHALDWLQENENWVPDAVCLLQPTSPLRTPDDIEEAVKIYNSHDADAVLSVCEMHDHPYLARKIADDGSLVPLVEHDIAYTRRQDLPDAYYPNGAIYLNSTKSLREQQTFYPEKIYPYLMPSQRSLQIDTEWDFKIAESAARLLQ